MIELKDEVVAQRVLELARLKATVEKGLPAHDELLDVTVWDVLKSVEFEYIETLGESKVVCFYCYEISGSENLYIEIKSDFTDPSGSPKIFCFVE